MTYKINHSNIKDWAKNYDGELFDGILCDPPYELGFMGKSWDSSGIAFDVDMWADIFKLLKPGGHLLAFSGSRTYHRMAVAIEDAGFEIRDQLIYIYGSGFPKALNINKQLNTCNCGGNAVPYNHDKQNTEHNVRLMPNTDISQTNRTATEQGQVLQSGVSEQSTHRPMQGQEPSKGLEAREEPSVEGRKLHRARKGLQDAENARTPQGEAERLRAGTHSSDGTDNRQTATGRGRSTSPEQAESGQPTRELETIRESHYTLDGESLRRCSKCERPILQGEYKTALKPSHEPCVLARKPLAKGMTVANNVLTYGTGGLAIDNCRIETSDKYSYPNGAGGNGFHGGVGREPDGSRVDATESNTLGRFPANLIHDGSDEVEAVFPQTGSGTYSKQSRKRKGFMLSGSEDNVQEANAPDQYGDSGSASRYFYTAKASKRERNAGLEGFEDKERTDYGGFHSEKGLIENNRNPENRVPMKNGHPTVKPLSLTKYLATLIKPPSGGRLLVPFSGSGSEMIGALQAGWEYVEGVELTEEYIPIAEARIKYWLEQKKLESKQLKQESFV